MRKSIHLLAEREKQLLERAQPKVYRELSNGDDLRIHLYLPKDLKEGEERPAILFFNSGAWDRGSVIQFAPHALYFVDRGAVCGLVEYRDQASHPGTNPMEAAQDAQMAVQYIRHYAESLHVDPEKVVVFGAGAGANIAACTAMKAAIPYETHDYDALPRVPNAAVLFSTIIDIQKGGYASEQFSDGGKARQLSLSRYIHGGIPPMLMIHGTADRFVPFHEAQQFADRMLKKRASFTLVDFEGRDQNFFNMNTDPASYEAALVTVDRFFDEHEILAKPEGDEGESRLISWRESDF